MCAECVSDGARRETRVPEVPHIWTEGDAYEGRTQSLWSDAKYCL